MGNWKYLQLQTWWFRGRTHELLDGRPYQTSRKLLLNGVEEGFFYLVDMWKEKKKGKAC